MENNNPSNFQTGDLVVGSHDPNKSVYSATGTKIIPQGVTIYGNPEELEARAEELTSMVLRHGGKQMVSSQKKPIEKALKGKSKTKQSQSLSKQMQSFSEIGQYSAYVRPEPVQEEPKKLLSLHFENSFGNIRAKVEHVVENNLAFMLIFTDEDAMVFEPRIGETLVLRTHNKERHEVYYPGVTFDLPETDKKLMVLFKVPEATEETSE